MKKIFLLPILIIAFFISSCEDDSTDPLPIKVPGQFVKLDIQQRSLDFSNINTTAFRGTLSVPANNVVRYELFVRRRNPNGINTSNFKLLQTITTFPYELNITPAQIAAAVGTDVASLQTGDIYRFIGYSYDAAGNKAGFLNLSAELRNNATMKQGYKWSVDLPTAIDPLVPFNSYENFGL